MCVCVCVCECKCKYIVSCLKILYIGNLFSLQTDILEKSMSSFSPALPNLYSYQILHGIMVN